MPLDDTQGPHWGLEPEKRNPAFWYPVDYPERSETFGGPCNDLCRGTAFGKGEECNWCGFIPQGNY